MERHYYFCKKFAFTLANRTMHIALSKGRRKIAFTLAEVLITLGIIGVVAALVMPALIANINERTNSHREANIAYKITQATDKMKAMGLLNGSYTSTDEFVDELQKHLKIVKRCDANHIADCWPTAKVKTADGEEYEVSKARRGRHIYVPGNNTDNVGLVLADGASIILTYNQASSGMDIGDAITSSPKSLPVGSNKSENFAYTTNTTAAIDFVMDVNGKKGPNSEARNNKFNDIRSFKAAKFSAACNGVKVPGIGCVVNLGRNYECISEEPYTNGDNCWAGARKACDNISMTLSSKSTLENIYNKKSSYPELPQSGTFWISPEYSASRAEIFYFINGSRIDDRKNNKNLDALCVD